ncbi:MAG TPA: hypothetical protein VII31_07495, partial [Caldimonas sp.]
MLLIAIVVGAMVGALASGEGGALAGALFGWLIVRSLRQQREIEALRKRAETAVAVAPSLAARSAGVASDEAAPAAGEPITERAPDTVPVPWAEAPVTRSVDVDTALLSPPATPEARAAASGAAVLAATPSTTTSARAIAGGGVPHAPPRDPLAPLKRWLFGGNTIVKAGIGILFIGLAFLAKYASE